MDASVTKTELTASQEDYLEAIGTLIWGEGVARVRDIADRLDVSMPSVTGALKTLAKHGLVDYKPHRHVTLSDRGMKLAEEISARHLMLRRFLTEVLDVEEELADRNACRIEHAVDAVVSQKLNWFVEFISSSSHGKQWGEQFDEFCAEMQAAGTYSTKIKIQSGAARRKKAMTLADIKPGQKAKIVRIDTTAATNKRLAVMGMTRNEIISVIRIAPLGDPIEVKIRGYSLSLRKGQARGIEVEQVQ